MAKGDYRVIYICGCDHEDSEHVTAGEGTRDNPRRYLACEKAGCPCKQFVFSHEYVEYEE